MAAVWFLAGLAVGCDGTGTDRCGGECRGKEQCLPVDMEVKCNFFGVCTKRGYTCVDPAKVKIPLSVDGLGSGEGPPSGTAAGDGGSVGTDQ